MTGWIVAGALYVLGFIPAYSERKSVGLLILWPLVVVIVLVLVLCGAQPQMKGPKA